ncbi:MAG TPA: 4'-phosphopantetheinyl transferase superfamily protein [Tepidisphaeraceae bacterium]|jgi:4'-phosphopantetheinyl transferase
MNVSPPSSSVTVWLARVEPSPAADALAAAYAVLDPYERQRAAAVLKETTRTAFIFAHALTRWALSTRGSVAPADWRFGRESSGKPFVTGPAASGLSFNISHTDGLITCAVAGGEPVGVDVECVRRPVDVRLFERVLSAAERAELAGLADDAQRRRFYAIWTAKEAYAKATGRGVSEALRDMTVDTAEGQPTLIGVDAIWRVHRIDAGADHSVAVAVQAERKIDVHHIRCDAWPPIPA